MSNQLIAGAPSKAYIGISQLDDNLLDQGLLDGIQHSANFDFPTPTQNNRGTGQFDSGLLDEGVFDDTQFDHGDGFDIPTPGDNLDV